VARKTDGTLWRWDSDTDTPALSGFFDMLPVRLGTHSDWIAVGSSGWEILSLAADGNLWSWAPAAAGNIDFGEEWNLNLFISASKKPAWIDNIFGAQE
jgi:hypothetical protein